MQPKHLTAVRLSLKVVIERLKKQFDDLFKELFQGFNLETRAIKVDPKDLIWEMRNFKITENVVKP